MICFLVSSTSIAKSIVEKIRSHKIEYSTKIRNPQNQIIKVDQPIEFATLVDAHPSMFDCLQHPIAIMTIASSKEEFADLNLEISNYFVDKPFIDNVNCLEYYISYLSRDSGNVHHILKSENDIDSMLKHFYSQLYPFIEAVLHNLHEQVGAVRRGITGRFFSTTRKMWKSSDLKSLTYMDAEMQTRRLADLSFYCKDYSYCYGLYDTLKRDFVTDQKLEYAAHCEEMMTRIEFLKSDVVDLRIDMFSLFSYHQNQQYYLRKLIDLKKIILKDQVLINTILKLKDPKSKVEILRGFEPQLKNRKRLYVSFLCTRILPNSKTDLLSLMSNSTNEFILKHFFEICHDIEITDDLYKIAQKLFLHMTTFKENELYTLLTFLGNYKYFEAIQVAFPRISVQIVVESFELQGSEFSHSISSNDSSTEFYKNIKKLKTSTNIPVLQPFQISTIKIPLKNPFGFPVSFSNIELHLNNITLRTTDFNLLANESALLIFSHSFEVEGDYSLDRMTFTVNGIQLFLKPEFFKFVNFKVENRDVLHLKSDIPLQCFQNQVVNLKVTLNNPNPKPLNVSVLCNQNIFKKGKMAGFESESFIAIVPANCCQILEYSWHPKVAGKFDVLFFIDCESKQYHLKKNVHVLESSSFKLCTLKFHNEFVFEINEPCEILDVVVVGLQKCHGSLIKTDNKCYIRMMVQSDPFALRTISDTLSSLLKAWSEHSKLPEHNNLLVSSLTGTISDTGDIFTKDILSDIRRRLSGNDAFLKWYLEMIQHFHIVVKFKKKGEIGYFYESFYRETLTNFQYFYGLDTKLIKKYVGNSTIGIRLDIKDIKTLDPRYKARASHLSRRIGIRLICDYVETEEIWIRIIQNGYRAIHNSVFNGKSSRDSIYHIDILFFRLGFHQLKLEVSVNKFPYIAVQRILFVE
eukprot:NODE_3_length_80033_cov_0.932970.p2 type:complete len:916 gc:universal NODE_3_length_80033_cov_0.932970:41911-39164(-)